MTYKDYQKSRDLVWKIILDMGFAELPIRVSEICKKLNISLLTYRGGKKIIDRYQLQKKAKQTDGFTLCANGRYIILYNEQCSDQRNRFTIAHELGHILLKHITTDGVHITTINREPSPRDDPEEQQANVFAARLLAPACVLWGMHVSSAPQIAEVCQISETAATFRMNRLQLLYDREKRFFAERGKSCFCLSPLEQKVYKQFHQYIYSHLL